MRSGLKVQKISVAATLEPVRDPQAQLPVFHGAGDHPSQRRNIFEERESISRMATNSIKIFAGIGLMRGGDR